MRVVREMKGAWFGSDTATGARELGPRWVNALKSKQKTQFGHSNPDPILDLTWLLTTGRASKPLEDFLGGDCLQGIQKWETIMSDALIKLRDYSEKRLVPACQRLHLVLEELQGWRRMTRQYSLFQLENFDLAYALEHSARGIVLGSLLAAVARRELFRFKEFIAWLRFEIVNAPGPAETNVPRHDILEVNNYLISGLASSEIDAWFDGKLDPFEPHHLGVPTVPSGTLASVIRRAAAVATNPTDPAWKERATNPDHRRLGKNLIMLSEQLAARCNIIFTRAAGAASRSASIHHREPLISPAPAEPNPRSEFSFRERIVQNEASKSGNYILAPVKNENQIVLSQIRYGAGSGTGPVEIGLAIVEVVEGTDETPAMMAADFFDDEGLIVVYRVKNHSEFLHPPLASAHQK
ncbi:hypothetical protein MD484_g211, partial [Candolleomyces efflorescens]